MLHQSAAWHQQANGRDAEASSNGVGAPEVYGLKCVGDVNVSNSWSKKVIVVKSPCSGSPTFYYGLYMWRSRAF